MTANVYTNTLKIFFIMALLLYHDDNCGLLWGYDVYKGGTMLTLTTTHLLIMKHKLYVFGSVLVIALALIISVGVVSAQTSTGSSGGGGGGGISVCRVGYDCMNVAVSTLAPSMNLKYDSAGKESYLLALFNVKVTANEDIAIQVGTSSAVASNVSFIDQNGKDAFTSGKAINVIPQGGLAILDGEYGRRYVVVKKGSEASFTIWARVYTTTLFAGSYQAVLKGVSKYTNGDVTSVFIPVTSGSVSTDPKTIVGEVSPYITEAKVVRADDTVLVTVYGQRLDGRIFVDGVEYVGGYKGGGDTIGFAMTLAPGNHSLSISNSTTGLSNAVGFFVAPPVSDATVTVAGTPTLVIGYNAAGKESSLKATFNLSVNGGTTGINIYTNNAWVSFNPKDTKYSASASSITMSATGGDKGTDSSGQSYISIAPNQIAKVQIIATANPQVMFAGTYSASLGMLYATSYSNPRPEFGFKKEVPFNQSNYKTIIGETTPYITSILPTTAIYNQTVRIEGKRLVGTKLMIDGVVRSDASYSVASDGNSSKFILPKIADGWHNISLYKSIGNSNYVGIQTYQVRPSPVTLMALQSTTEPGLVQYQLTADSRLAPSISNVRLDLDCGTSGVTVRHQYGDKNMCGQSLSPSGNDGNIFFWSMKYTNPTSVTQNITTTGGVYMFDSSGNRTSTLGTAQATVSISPTGTSTPTTPSCYTFTVNLTVGSTGPDVMALQTWLVNHGFATSDIVTGYYAASTKAAVAKYQTAVGISSDGYFGPITRPSINSQPCTPTPPTVFVCPVGYICEPVTPTTPQISTCPKGYTCTPVQPTVNEAPKITSYNYTPANPKVGDTVSLYWTASDANNDDLAWSLSVSTPTGGGGGSTGSCSLINSRKGMNKTFSTTYQVNAAGAYTFTAGVNDCNGGSASKAVTVNVGDLTDVTAPVITNVRTTAVYANDVRIEWTTNETSTTRVEYGMTSALGSVISRGEDMTSSHSIYIPGLSSNTQYYYRVVSMDASGNTAKSDTLRFVTAVSPTPTSVPYVPSPTPELSPTSSPSPAASYYANPSESPSPSSSPTSYRSGSQNANIWTAFTNFFRLW
jgi:hypothetical protein